VPFALEETEHGKVVPVKLDLPVVAPAVEGFHPPVPSLEPLGPPLDEPDQDGQGRLLEGDLSGRYPAGQGKPGQQTAEILPKGPIERPASVAVCRPDGFPDGRLV
jgi:hypothetical protein